MASLVPIAVLALAGAGQSGGPPPLTEPALLGPERLAGRTSQGLPVALGVEGRAARWRIRYDHLCDDGRRMRGRTSSGGGTPRLRLRSDGAFALRRTEPTAFADGSRGSVTFALRGRVRDGAARGTWTVRVTRPGPDRLSCATGSLSWRAERAAGT
jgi:hypothetical protein